MFKVSAFECKFTLMQFSLSVRNGYSNYVCKDFYLYSNFQKYSFFFSSVPFLLRLSI